MITVIMEDTHFHEDEHDFKGHERSQKARLAKFFLALSFINRFS